jgi:hypothetical protein
MQGQSRLFPIPAGDADVGKVQYSSRAFSVVKQFSTPAFYFAAANVANFMQGRNSVATGIALFNLAWVSILIGGSFYLENLLNRWPKKKYFKAISRGINNTSPTDSPTEKAFRLVGREVSNPMRVTAYCALAVSAVLLVGSGGVGAALFPGLAGLFFGTGNFIQSSSKLGATREHSKTNPITNAMLHPASWYGLGYAATGLGIGGGLSLLFNPLSNPQATFMTLIGIAETATSLGLMISGLVTNAAAPFVGVAAGTLVFAAVGLATGNALGIVTGLFACAGELSLAVLAQEQHNKNRINNPNANPASKIESFLTAPIRAAMKRGWLAPLPIPASVQLIRRVDGE